MKTKTQMDSFMKTLELLLRRPMKRGYATEKERRLLLNAWSWFAGFPVTIELLEELGQILDAREKDIAS